MLKNKKNSLLILALSSSVTFAGTMGPVCTEDNLSTPCEYKGWDVAGRALYIQPTYVGNAFLIGSLNSTTNVTTWQKLPQPWAWGYEIEGSFHFDTGNDINVNWYHFNNRVSKSFTNVATSSSFTAGTPASATAAGSFSTAWNAINGEFGQQVKIGDHKSLRLHAGGAYVQINNKLNLSVTSIPTEYDKTWFSGFGPRAGGQLAYGFGFAPGFALYGDAAVAAFVGNNKFSSLTNGFLDAAGGSLGRSTIIVPSIEGKLGGKYTYQTAQGSLTLDAGYLWVDYINAQSLVTSQAAISGVSGFGINGAYFGLKWLGSI